jgi:hypothetical protein
VDGPASRRKFVFGIVFLGASRWPPQIVIRYMARSERLFDRLDELERDYRALITKACRDSLDHRFSKAAIRALEPGLLDGKFWRDEEAAQLEYLEKEIRNLLQKLALPFSESAIFKVEQLREAYGRCSEGERRRLLSDFIAQQSSAVGRAI